MMLISSPNFDKSSTSNVNYHDDDTADNFDNPPNSNDSEDDSCTDEESEVKINPVWCPRTAELRQIPFTGEPGLKYNFVPDARPTDYFNVLVSNVF